MQIHVHKKFWMSVTWGLSDSTTWWNRDFNRKKGGSCIVIRTGGSFMKGFSPNCGDCDSTKEVGDLLRKIVSGGPGMVKFVGY